MRAIELLQENPESSKLICKYYLEIMLESLNDDNLPEDFKAHVREQGIDEDKIAAIIDSNPRNLFDFFDDQGIFINISTTNNGKTYQCDVSQDLKGESQGGYTRKEADLKGVIIAIEMLEKKLNLLEKDNKDS